MSEYSKQRSQCHGNLVVPDVVWSISPNGLVCKPKQWSRWIYPWQKHFYTTTRLHLNKTQTCWVVWQKCRHQTGLNIIWSQSILGTFQKHSYFSNEWYGIGLKNLSVICYWVLLWGYIGDLPGVVALQSVLTCIHICWYPQFRWSWCLQFTRIVDIAQFGMQLCARLAIKLLYCTL